MSEFCPLIKKKCKKHDCKFYANVLGPGPQVNESVNVWDCSITLLPMIVVENTKFQRGTQKAIEQLRNHVSRVRDIFIMLGGKLSNRGESLEKL